MVSSLLVKVTVNKNSLKTIISRITTMNESKNSLKEIGIAVKNSTGELRNVEDILSDLAGRWNTLTEEQRQNLGKYKYCPLCQ